MNRFSRRDAVKTSSLLLLGGTYLPAFLARAQDASPASGFAPDAAPADASTAAAFPSDAAPAAPAADPHFFIFFNLFPGADPSYMFDARHLTLTNAGKMQNYTGKDPAVWTGSNGQTTLASALTPPLQEFQNNFSVINGVMMSGFDGHDQNQAFLLTGSPFGGDSFVPQLNQTNGLPIDALLLTQLFNVPITNGGASLTTDAQSLASLSQIFQGASSALAADPTQQLIASRMQTLAGGPGSLALGAGQMQRGFSSAGDLTGKISATSFQIPAAGAGGTTQPQGVPIDFQVIGQYFKLGIARSLMLGFQGTFDTHDSTSCGQQPALFTSLIQHLVDLLRYLKNTPYDQTGKSLLDVTTFMIASEFGRTMRQLGASSVSTTGTDHNPLSNSVVIGGKGVKGGLVLGASDMTDLDATGNFTNVSGAHKQLDGNLLKVMGKPFDYTKFMPVATLPEAFDPTQYLGFGAVTNTVYRIFGYKEQDVPYRRFTSGGNVIPFLAPLIA